MICPQCRAHNQPGAPYCAGCRLVFQPEPYAYPPQQRQPPLPVPPQPQPQPLPEPPAVSHRQAVSGPALAERVFSHRPQHFPNVFAWLTSGVFRDWRSVAAALVASWFNLPLAIVCAVAGGIAGAILGVFHGAGRAPAELAEVPVLGTALDSFLFQGGGVVGGLLGFAAGTVLGFLGGLVLPWKLAFDGDPAGALGIILGQVLVSLLMGSLYTVYGVALEGWRFTVDGGRRLSRREAELLLPIVEKCAADLGLAGRPRVLISDRRGDINACAGTRHIMLERGMLEQLQYDRDAIAGIICHELAHWANGDVISALFVRGMALPLYLMCNLFAVVRDQAANPVLRFAAGAFGWSVLVLQRFFLVPVLAVDARRAELRADRAAVVAGYRAGLRTALVQIGRTERGSNGWEQAICASHPPTELRLEAIEEQGGSYPLPDPDSPAQPFPVVVASTVSRGYGD
ncbi:M48 family metalloprotease [Longispora albida]|uniref:M48 family metalloprotease n=1 Tax=Longispora albida TaxID=203523 RepID=UPI0003A13DF8|nr:M48 family metalloprotease [Longispora albida]